MSKKILFGMAIICLQFFSCNQFPQEDYVDDEVNYYPEEQEPNDNFDLAMQISRDGRPIAGTLYITHDNLGNDDIMDVFWFYGEKGCDYKVVLKWISGESLDLKGNWYAYDYNQFFTLDATSVKEDEVDVIHMGQYEGRCYLAVCENGISPGEYSISVTKQ